MVKVAILGAAGGIGQPLSLLLKQNTLVSHLALYDIVSVSGIAADLSHINTASTVTAHVGPDSLRDAVTNAHIVLIAAGVPRKPGMFRNDLFKLNAGIIENMATVAAKYCPKAYMLIVTNPVNSTVPIVAKVFKKAGVYDAKRLFGVSTLDSVRASRFVTEIIPELNPISTSIPVIGGHSGNTIVPLLSQLSSTTNLSKEQIEALTHHIQYAGDEIIVAKGGITSATLSMAHAGSRFVGSILEATVNGTLGIIEPAYVHLEADAQGGDQIKKETDCDFFATNVELGVDGIARVVPFGSISPYEKNILENAIAELKENIKLGLSYIRDYEVDPITA
ncbi:malate dehydrogenase, NAD-dependent [Basidiobolus meristosporus CBS 931.73]|uniref:malate dehydrogenase n=1 Tax=Basidiobolus meristosporus CBS 931.73 TaxID=1314790 RepID=A0A1Y1XW68_9FUNG|nr:malate dehydrogenase, NAD-dependent [Basidiobolus meristosporus CBS 931.73]|eukprot:ORX89935.1 malate dehydrogenase, NAD-dependent [Basidiobolus meristosporus CBS 931.73]